MGSHSSDSNSASPPSAQEIDVPFSHYWKLWSRLRSSGIVANGFGKGIRGVIRRRGELAGDVAFGNGTFFDPEHGRAGVSIENEQTPTLGSGSDDRDGAAVSAHVKKNGWKRHIIVPRIVMDCLEMPTQFARAGRRKSGARPESHPGAVWRRRRGRRERATG